MRISSGVHAVIAAAILAGPAAARAASTDEPPLRLAPALSALPPTPVGDDEKAVLRLEWKAGQSRADEAAALDHMLARLNRIGQTVSELRLLVETMPYQAPADCPPAAAAEEEPGLPWLALGGGALVLMLAGLIWRRRAPRPLPAEPAFEPTILVAPAPAPPRSPTPNSECPPTPPAEPIDDTAAGFPTLAPMATPAFETRPIAAADEALELVDIMVSMGLNQGAAETLEEHIRQHPRQALYHWLKLLDVFRHSGREAEYEQAAGELRKNFNVMPGQWAATDAALGHARLEDYPHITERLQDLWRHEHCEEYLTRLLQDNRGGTRTGFPQPVAEEILLLLSIARS